MRGALPGTMNPTTLVAVSLTLVLVACSAGTTSSTTTSSSSGESSGGETCDLKASNWYSACSKGCGDVMACQSFCSGCEAKCMVPCETSADCERVGAGSCEKSAKASNRCSKAPSKCP